MFILIMLDSSVYFIYSYIDYTYPFIKEMVLYIWQRHMLSQENANIIRANLKQIQDIISVYLVDRVMMNNTSEDRFLFGQDIQVWNSDIFSSIVILFPSRTRVGGSNSRIFGIRGNIIIVSWNIIHSKTIS